MVEGEEAAEAEGDGDGEELDVMAGSRFIRWRLRDGGSKQVDVDKEMDEFTSSRAGLHCLGWWQCETRITSIHILALSFTFVLITLDYHLTLWRLCLGACHAEGWSERA